MLIGWGNLTKDMSPDAFCDQVAERSLEAVAMACRRLSAGEVPGVNIDFPPAAARLAEQARVFDEIIARRDKPTQELVIVPIGAPMPEGMVPAGLLTVDFGHGRIDMRNRSHAEQEEILQNKGLPAGKTMLPGLKRMQS